MNSNVVIAVAVSILCCFFSPVSAGTRCHSRRLRQSALRDCKIELTGIPNPPMFVELFGYSHRFISLVNDTVSFRPGTSLIATCQDQYMQLLKKPSKPSELKSVMLSCDTEKNVVKMLLNGKYVDFDPARHQFVCENSIIQFYHYPVTGCSYTGVLAAFNNKLESETEQVKLIEYCYDEYDMRTIFANYVIAARSSYLNVQVTYNTGVANKSAHIQQPKDIIKMFSEDMDRLYDEERFGKQFSQLFGDLYPEMSIDKTDIVPLENIRPQFRSACNTFLNAAPQWTGLQNGNWQKLQEDIRNIVHNGEAQVYTGTSGLISLENSSKFKISLYLDMGDMYEFTIPIPLYYWHVVITNSYQKPPVSDEARYVVISINNPFLTLDEIKNFVICEDVCDQLPWIAKLNVTRKMPALGYTYCCNLDTIKGALPEIPANVYRKAPETILGTKNDLSIPFVQEQTTLRPYESPNVPEIPITTVANPTAIQK